MKSFLSEVLRERGEGIILRQPGSLYEQGTSKSVLKLKVIFVIFMLTNIHTRKQISEDAEAQITRIDGSLYTCVMCVPIGCNSKFKFILMLLLGPMGPYFKQG